VVCNAFKNQFTLHTAALAWHGPCSQGWNEHHITVRQEVALITVDTSLESSQPCVLPQVSYSGMHRWQRWCVKPGRQRNLKRQSVKGVGYCQCQAVRCKERMVWAMDVNCCLKTVRCNKPKTLTGLNQNCARVG
jgi:hypothetical protein